MSAVNNDSKQIDTRAISYLSQHFKLAMLKLKPVVEFGTNFEIS